MKTFFRSIFSIIFLCSSILGASPSSRQIDSIEEDDLFTQLFDEDSNQFDELDQLKDTSCLSCEEILSLLLSSEFNLALLLRNNIFIRTNYINIRNIIDSPILGRTRLHDERAVVQLELFYEHSEKAFFTKKSTFINSILSLDNPDINNVLPFVSELSGIGVDTILKVLGIIDNTKIQERQTGFMLSAGGNHGPWHLTGRAPLYWVEHNFYLTDSEQCALSEIVNPIPPSDQEVAEFEAFFTKRLVADRLGVGDTRLKLEHLFYQGMHLHGFAGLSFTIPTAFTISSGLIGGKFQKRFERPDFSIRRIIDLLMCPPTNPELAQELGLQFLEGALCQLTANVADRGLGNGGHFGIAPTIDLYNIVGENLGLEFYGAFEYLLPADESRYFVERKNVDRLTMIANNFQNFDDEQCNAALTFLNQQVINTFYPFVVRTRVRPGVLLKLRPSVHHFRDGFTAWFGYDFWFQGQESLLEFDGIQAPLLDRLEINRGRKSKAIQGRLFFDARWFIYSDALMDWEFAIKSDWTIHNVGIGRAFTAAIGFQGIF